VIGPFDGLRKPTLIGVPVALVPLSDGAAAALLLPPSDPLSSLQETTEKTHAAATNTAAIRPVLLRISMPFRAAFGHD
jgi:hypothetical protein